MRYASDNRAVQAVYSFTTGPNKPIFITVVLLLALVSVYFPVRDLYVAHRVNTILEQQMAIREKYNDGLEDEVNRYLSKEGIEAAAREQGMVMPGEKAIIVEGLDDDGDSPNSDSESPQDGAPEAGENPAESKDGDEPLTSSQVEDAERRVIESSPWYYRILDAIFLFEGTSGQVAPAPGSSDE